MDLTSVEMEKTYKGGRDSRWEIRSLVLDMLLGDAVKPSKMTHRELGYE